MVTDIKSLDVLLLAVKTQRAGNYPDDSMDSSRYATPSDVTKKRLFLHQRMFLTPHRGGGAGYALGHACLLRFFRDGFLIVGGAYSFCWKTPLLINFYFYTFYYYL